MTRPRRKPVGVNEQSAPVGWYWCPDLDSWRHPIACGIRQEKEEPCPRCEHRKEKHETTD
jgi:hypothetical protein